MSSIYIGHCDPGCIPSQPKTFLDRFHNVAGSAALKGRLSFRDDDRSTWRLFKELSNSSINVKDINDFLHESGFMPRARTTSVFDYVTQASVRLFQEYLRTIDGIVSMVPDGIVGPKTYSFMQQWQASGRCCHWANGGISDEYHRWMNALTKAKSTYADNLPLVLQKTEQFQKPTDTRKLGDWSFNANDIHLIGLRQQEQSSAETRASDDIFVLLINGLVFKFWGSTDPNAHLSGRDDEAYLVEGQHKYRFSWHKVSDARKIYRALRPYQHGVLVFRDRNSDNALTNEDIRLGLDPSTNYQINIHWSGIGSSNWSAGCQVIAGESYINDLGHTVHCANFAARNYSELNRQYKKTKGAYNVLTDLILCYAPASVDYLLYSLGRDDSFLLSDVFEADYVSKTFADMQV